MIGDIMPMSRMMPLHHCSDHSAMIEEPSLMHQLVMSFEQYDKSLQDPKSLPQITESFICINEMHSFISTLAYHHHPICLPRSGMFPSSGCHIPPVTSRMLSQGGGGGGRGGRGGRGGGRRVHSAAPGVGIFGRTDRG